MVIFLQNGFIIFCSSMVVGKFVFLDDVAFFVQ